MCYIMKRGSEPMLAASFVFLIPIQFIIAKAVCR